jgi:AraC-like DNA-binding protein
MTAALAVPVAGEIFAAPAETFTVPSALVQSIIGDCDEETAYSRFTQYAFVSSLVFTNAAKRFRGYLEWERFRARDLKQQHRLEQVIQKKKKSERILEKRFGIKRPIKILMRWEESDKRRFIKLLDSELWEELCLEKTAERLRSALYESYCSNASTVQNISGNRPPFPPPHWIGEPRPEKAKTVRLESHFPPIDYITRLVKHFGYDKRAAFSTVFRQPTAPPDRGRTRVCDYENESDDPQINIDYVAPPHLYYQASPTLNTRWGGGFRKEVITRAIAKHRWSDSYSSGVYQVVYIKRRIRPVNPSFPVKKLE